MSRLPKGTKASRSFLEGVIIDGMMLKAIAFQPWIGWPVFKQFFRAILERIIVDPGLDQAVVIAIAATFVTDRIAFDKAFITLVVLEESGASHEQLEFALQNAEAAMKKFIRRGPLE